MKKFLSKIRSTENRIPPNKKIANTIGILLIGIALGTFSKFLDNTAVNELPALFEILDVGNFLGRFPIWVVIALCISVYSGSSGRAAINVFVFFTGMVSSYYLYSYYFAGFFPRSYAMIWIGFTVISPLLAFVCWYAKGEGKISFILSAMIFAVLFNMTFVYGWFYFDMRSILELITFICALAAIKRKTIQDTIVMIAIGISIAFVLNLIVPFHFG